MVAAASALKFEPGDQYNRSLASNVHPFDWVNPAPKGRYNLVVVGGGTAGLVTPPQAPPASAPVSHLSKRT